MTRTVVASLVSRGAARDLMSRRCHRIARLWRITRRDGQVFHATDHDRQVQFQGEAFSPIGVLRITALSRQKGLAPTSRDVAGYVVATFVTHDELRAGMWEGATVLETEVDWKYPFLGPTGKRWFEVGSIAWNGETFDVRMVGFGASLELTVGDRLSRQCRKKLETCGADLTGLVLAGVSVQSSSPDRRVNLYTTDYTSATLPSGAQYDRGTVEFTSSTSPLIRVVRWPIKTVITSPLGVDIELQLPLPADIDNGDEFTLRPGCDQTWNGGCLAYNNRPNYGGFPNLPGGDRANEVP